MSVDERTIFLRYVQEIWIERNVAAIEELIAPNFISRITGSPDIVGLEGYRRFYSALLTAFPDLQNTLEDMLVEGDKVAARWTSHGTHKGEYFGISPTGKFVTSTMTVIYRIAEGKIVEIRGDADNLGLLQQLGAAA